MVNYLESVKIIDFIFIFMVYVFVLLSDYNKNSYYICIVLLNS